ncbi:glycosyltransferase family 8 protein [bacterium]|nr:glycosyltransferase family 8 protein [bacterium]
MPEIRPAFSENNIPVCFACDNDFAKFTAVAVQSVIENASENFNYDILILNENFDAEMVNKFEELTQKNISVRCVNISDFISDIDDKINDVTKRKKIVYYRFFVPRIFSGYKKIIYLDGDLVLEDDVAKLFAIDLENNCIGAVNDIFMKILLQRSENWVRYLKLILKMEVPENYFQSGVMVFNIPNMLEENITERLLERLNEIGEPMIVDQDIYNSVCQNNVKFIEPVWNYDRNIEILIDEYDYSNEEINKLVEIYQKVKMHPKIIHFAGSMKPWQYPLINFADRWRYYEEKSVKF